MSSADGSSAYGSSGGGSGSGPNRLVDDLCWLVDIRSVTGEERELRDAIAGRLSATVEVEKVGESLVVGRRTGKPRIDLYGHLDTVPENGNLPARIEAGRVNGLGTTDMKSGLALMLAALRSEAVANGPYDVFGIFYDREEGPAAENGLDGVLDEVGHLGDAELALVMEPTDNELQLGCQGTINASVVFEGEAAHSARPWLGENAVTKAGVWLAEMHRREARDVMVEGLMFRETFVVTTASGGVARNVIPASFALNVNHRYPPDRSSKEAEQILADVCAAADRFEIVDRAPAAPIPGDNRHVERLKASGVAAVTAKTAWTDVARLALRGIPAVNFGPGEVSLAHRADESVSIEALETGWTILEQFLTTQ
ncbi:MAG: succinyl-diaminopimelate desuccinylase [Acidobacteria bacterium]|nr:succinyl-diaminopimelate desuccinylase [Acidobacteriota bacterium]